MNNQKIPTGVGTIIIVIIAITVGVFVWKYEKNQETTGQKQNLAIQLKPAEKSDGQQSLDQKPNENINAGIIIEEPIEKWKTCKNTKVGYVVKYPSEWETRTKNLGGVIKVNSCNMGQLIFTKSDSRYRIGPNSIGIIYQDTYKGTGFVFEGSKSLDDYFKKWPEMAKNFPIIKETIIDNEKAVYIEDYPNPRVLVYHHDRIFDISGGSISEQTFTNFLSTFKFLE